MTLDENYLKSLREELTNKTNAVNIKAENLRKDEEQLLSDEKNLQEQERIFKKTVDRRLSKFMEHPENIKKEEIRQQVVDIITARETLETRRNQINLRKSLLEEQIKKLEKLDAELKAKETELEEEKRILKHLFKIDGE